ncbi:restriction endonuclease [Streptomyces bobili]|uniref:restriction endonuclease n=1 Tax=Streptomyces bobili TaxID=67280 RepID=UPI00344941F5
MYLLNMEYLSRPQPVDNRVHTDITARTADGHTLAVQCKNRAGRSTVPSADMQKFVGAARIIGRMDAALFVATCNFNEAQAIADLSGVITVTATNWRHGAPQRA